MTLYLPPLPDIAVPDGPGHVSDHNEFRAYILEVAKEHAVEIGDIPEAVQGQDGHATHHELMVNALDKIAKAIGAKITLPKIPKVGDTAHVSDHNVLRQACIDIETVRPFSISGYDQKWVDEANGYTWVMFGRDKDDPYEMRVTGAGDVLVMMVGGGGGGGGGASQATTSWDLGFGGSGGGGVVALTGGQLPTVSLSSGLYYVTAGLGGEGGRAMDEGQPGNPSSITGAGVALIAEGGGGGGKVGEPARDGATGGGGAAAVYKQQTTVNAFRGGKGSKGGNGADGSGYDLMTLRGGGGGGMGGNAPGGVDGGPGWLPTDGTPEAAAYGNFDGGDEGYGHGGGRDGFQWSNPGAGGVGSNFTGKTGQKGRVMLGYKGTWG